MASLSDWSKFRRTSGWPMTEITKDPAAAYITATENKKGLIDHNTPVKAIAVKLALIPEDGLLGRPFSPKQPETFLGETVKTDDEGGCAEHPDVEQRLKEELGPVAILDSRHEVPAHIAVQNVQPVDSEQERDQQGACPFGLSAGLFGGGERLDALGETIPRFTID